MLPPIIVTAKRPDPRSDTTNRPGFVAMVDLSNRGERVDDLPEILSQLVGVHVTQYGGMGSFATVSIRGSTSSQVRTFLDGIPVDDPYLGVTNLSDLPLGGVDRVEVYRGFSPPALGGSAIGGAVQLVSRMEGPHDALFSGAQAGLSAGSFDTRREGASLWLKPGPFKFFAHATRERSTGNFEFLDDNGTPQNPDDDQIAVRANNDYDAWSGIVRSSVDVPGLGGLSLGYYDTSRENGVPGLGSNQSATARSERRRRIGQVRVDGEPILNERMLWSATGFYQRSVEQFHDPGHEIALSPTETHNTINAYGGNARLKCLVPGRLFSVEALAGVTTEQFAPASELPERTNGPDRWRRTMMIALGGDAYLIGQTLVVSGLVRYEQNREEFGGGPRYPWLPPSSEGTFVHNATSPSVGARWRAGQWLTFKGNMGRYHRLPTFLELFGNVGSVTGDASLEPETGINRDIGAVVNLARAGFARTVFAEVSYFDNSVDNLILFFPNSHSTVKASNIGSARIRGVEASVGAALTTSVNVTAGYTHLHTEDTSEIAYYNGNSLPSRPDHDLNLSLSYRWRALRTTYEFNYLSANFMDRANLQRTDARDLHALTLLVGMPVPGLSLSIEGRNLTDERTEDVAGFPLPGRSVFSTLAYRY